MGYDGWTGGGASLGSRPDGTILRLSGRRAASMGRDILRSDAHVSRIDVQATVRFNRDVQALARHHAGEARRSQRAGAQPRHLRLERSFGRGDTLYVGSRVSNYFGRVYDKWRESGDAGYRHSWRYEVEAKGAGALAVTSALTQAPGDEGAIEALVFSWWAARGIHPRYRPAGARALGPIPARTSELDTRLRWLLHQVRPVIWKVIPYVGRELVDDLLFSGWEEESGTVTRAVTHGPESGPIADVIPQ